MGGTALDAVTLIVPYYRNCRMLARQLIEWRSYPPGLQVILVDDGSPEPALPIVKEHWRGTFDGRLSVYRIDIDIPWNREGARNLGAHAATTEWIVHIDIDHLLPVSAAVKLLQFEPQLYHWYRFPRWRVGLADETRRKDAIPDSVEFGPIHPHIDSYLVTRRSYWHVGGYDEDFAGCLGGGTDFLKRLEEHEGQPLLLPHDIPLQVHTRSVIEDASDWSLSRDRSEGKARAQAKRSSGRSRPDHPMRFPWSRQV